MNEKEIYKKDLSDLYENLNIFFKEKNIPTIEVYPYLASFIICLFRKLKFSKELCHEILDQLKDEYDR